MGGSSFADDNGMTPKAKDWIHKQIQANVVSVDHYSSLRVQTFSKAGRYNSGAARSASRTCALIIPTACSLRLTMCSTLHIKKRMIR
jgi:hypothetical protein